MIRKIRMATVIVSCAVGLAACASTVELSRENVVQRLQPLLALENKYGQVQQVVRLVMSASREIPYERASSLKEHNDVYWVYHQAANVAIANGDMDSYKKHVEAAEREVDAMNMVVSEWSQSLLLEKGRTVEEERALRM